MSTTADDNIPTLDAPVKRKARKSKYPAYDSARLMALDLQINSRADYVKWHTENKITYLPRYPERVYKDWVSWNDWLGTANVFKGGKETPVRTFWEAVKWAQEFAALHNINTMAEWLAYCKEHSDELPVDIPIRPDTRYVEWQQAGWKTWLGTDVRGRLEAARQDTAVMALCSFGSLKKPGNAFAVVMAEKGEADLLEQLSRTRDLIIVRCYKITADVKEGIHDVLKKYGRNESEHWFIPDVASLLFELDLMCSVHILSRQPVAQPVVITEAMWLPDTVHVKPV